MYDKVCSGGMRAAGHALRMMCAPASTADHASSCRLEDAQVWRAVQVEACVRVASKLGVTVLVVLVGLGTLSGEDLERPAVGRGSQNRGIVAQRRGRRV